MKKILVTGATGFIGNYVIPELLNRGFEVVATSRNRRSAENCTWLDKVDYIELDLSKLEEQVNYFEYFQKPDALIHLAWEGLPNYKASFHYEENLFRHYPFLKNIIANGCRNVSVTGTCFEYGMKSGSLSEDMNADPDNSYAVAKYALYMFLREVAKQDKFNFKWIRLFYLYGKGQNPKALIPQLEAAIKSNEEVFNMSGGEQVRDYLRVETAASYIVTIALQEKVTGIINCCSGEPLRVKDLVLNYLREKGKNIRLNLGYYDYPDYEPMAFWGDNKKLQKILNEG